MALVLCSKCSSVDGVLCRACGKPNHFDFVRNRQGGGRWTADRYDRCWRVLRRSRERFTTCVGHEQPLSECDSCRVRAPSRPPEHGWKWPRDPEGWEDLKGLTGSKALLLCPSCQNTFRIGLDWSLERNGEPSLSESIACAFAFQLGQAAYSYEVGGSALFANLMVVTSPDFVWPPPLQRPR